MEYTKAVALQFGACLRTAQPVQIQIAWPHKLVLLAQRLGF